MGNVYVLRKQNDSGNFAGTALQMDSSGQGSLQIPIGTGKGTTGPLKVLPYLAGGYGALRSLASSDQTDLGTALGSAAMAGLTNYSTFNQLGAGAQEIIDPYARKYTKRGKEQTRQEELRDAQEAFRDGMGQMNMGMIHGDIPSAPDLTTQAPSNNTGNTVAQNLRENPIMPPSNFTQRLENIPQTPMPGQTPDSARMIQVASQMQPEPPASPTQGTITPDMQNVMRQSGSRMMPTPTGQMTDAQRAVMSQSGTKYMQATPDNLEAIRRNAQAQAGKTPTLDEFRG
jgi:hypothetical protein